MGRLCERPGCSELAAIAYGFDVDQLLVWLAVRDPDGDPLRAGGLCRRHADAMVVPLGWTLDDRRESPPRLFRSEPAKVREEPAKKRMRRKAATEAPTDQLALETDVVDAVDARLRPAGRPRRCPRRPQPTAGAGVPRHGPAALTH